MPQSTFPIDVKYLMELDNGLPLALMPALPERFAAGFHASDKENAGEQCRMARLPSVRGATAVLELFGVITQRGSGFRGTSTDTMGRLFDAAMDSPSIKAIVLNVDSPGGTVTGVDTLASKIRSARGEKPILSVSNSLMASAALWVGTAADQVIAVPSSDTGSHGVWSMHLDFSKALEQAGIKPTLVFSGKHKVDGHPFVELPDEVRQHMQERSDSFFDDFTGALAANRGVSKSHVLEHFGQGRVFQPAQAKAAGMVDRVMSFEELMRSIGANATSATRVQDERDTEMLCEIVRTDMAAPRKDPVAVAAARARELDLKTKVG